MIPPLGAGMSEREDLVPNRRRIYNHSIYQKHCQRRAKSSAPRD